MSMPYKYELQVNHKLDAHRCPSFLVFLFTVTINILKLANASCNNIIVYSLEIKKKQREPGYTH